MFAHACKVGLEGVVSKVRDSRYASGRGNDWVKKTCAQRETLTDRRLRARRQRLGRHLSRPPQGQRPDLRRQGRPRLRQDIGRGAAQAPDAADPEDPALHQADRAQGHLGRAGAARRDRVPREVGRGQGAAPVFQGPAGGPVMQWCDRCENCRWVCENHTDMPWFGARACSCEGAGTRRHRPSRPFPHEVTVDLERLSARFVASWQSTFWSLSA